MLASLRGEVAGAKRVVLLRFFEDDDPQGWMELKLLGLPKARLIERLAVSPGHRLASDAYQAIQR
jgi:hypothetical protein